MPCQFSPQQSATAAQTGHHGPDRDVQRLRGFAIREPLDIHQQHERPEAFRQVVECDPHRLGGEGVRRRYIDEQRRLADGIEIDEKRLTRAFAVLSRMCEEQNFVEPGAAVGAGGEAVERPPRLQIGFLHQVFGGLDAAAEARREAEQFRHVHQGRPVECFTPLMRNAEHRVAIVDVPALAFYSLE